MKRRAFLSLAGASALAPALPAFAQGVLPAKLRAMGIAHAQKYPMVSVMGLHRRMGISEEQARQLLSYLIEKGAIGQPGIPGVGASSAASRIFQPAPHPVLSVKRPRKAARRQTGSRADGRTPQTGAVSTDWLTHARVIAARNGFTLSPRALGAVA